MISNGKLQTKNPLSIKEDAFQTAVKGNKKKKVRALAKHNKCVKCVKCVKSQLQRYQNDQNNFI